MTSLRKPLRHARRHVSNRALVLGWTGFSAVAATVIVHLHG